MVNAAMQYRRALKKKLRCCKEVKNRLLEGFDKTFASYLEEHISPTIDDLFAAFGPPEEMARILMTEVTSQEQEQYHNNALFKKALVVILAVMLALFIAYILFIKNFRITSTTDVFETPNTWAETYNSQSKE